MKSRVNHVAGVGEGKRFQQVPIILLMKDLISARGSRQATDLRAEQPLVITGLLAHGKTEITNVEFILRGLFKYY